MNTINRGRVCGDCTEDWMEREVILYIGVSVDGYLADADGGVDWMKGHGAEEETAATRRFTRPWTR